MVTMVKFSIKFIQIPLLKFAPFVVVLLALLPVLSFFASGTTQLPAIELQPLWKKGEYWIPESYDGHTRIGWQYAVDFYFISHLNRPDTYRNADGEAESEIFAPHAGAVYLYLADVTADAKKRQEGNNFINVKFDSEGNPQPIPKEPFVITDRSQTPVYIDVGLIIVSQTNPQFSTWYAHLRINDGFFTEDVLNEIKQACKNIRNGKREFKTIETKKTVKAGECIGKIDQLGMARSPHLHFSVRRGNQNAGVEDLVNLVSDNVKIDGERILLSEEDPLCWKTGGTYKYPAMPRRKDTCVCVRINTAWDTKNIWNSLSIKGIGPGDEGIIKSKGKPQQFGNYVFVTYEVEFSRKKITTSVPGAYLDPVDCKAPGPMPSITATALVIDVSGSMSYRWRGGVKIESAKKAALQYIEQVANEPRPAGITHYIGVVTFSGSAQVVCPLTADYNEAKNTIIRLGTIAWTNLGAGLDVALQELSKLPSGKKFIILLSDGMTNTGKTREKILQTSVAEARRQGICIYTVGFGDPGDIDEKFLKDIASQSGCGTYNYASSGFELFTTYVKVRHATLGSNRIVEYKTTAPTYLIPGQSVALGAFQLTAPAQELHYTVAWSGPATLQAKLVDPQGRTVSSGYPNSVIYSGNGFSHITIFSPPAGIWRAAIIVKSASGQPVEYYGVASARTGGVVIPYYIPPCLVKLDDTCVIPMPDLPTVVIVAIGLLVIVLWIYNQFGGM